MAAEADTQDGCVSLRWVESYLGMVNGVDWEQYYKHYHAARDKVMVIEHMFLQLLPSIRFRWSRLSDADQTWVLGELKQVMDIMRYPHYDFKKKTQVLMMLHSELEKRLKVPTAPIGNMFQPKTQWVDVPMTRSSKSQGGWRQMSMHGDAPIHHSFLSSGGGMEMRVVRTKDTPDADWRLTEFYSIKYNNNGSEKVLTRLPDDTHIEGGGVSEGAWAASANTVEWFSVGGSPPHTPLANT